MSRARGIRISHMHLRMVYALAGEEVPEYLRHSPAGQPCAPIMERLANVRLVEGQEEYDKLYARLGYGDAGDLEMIDHQVNVAAGWVAGMIAKGGLAKKQTATTLSYAEAFVLPAPGPQVSELEYEDQELQDEAEACEEHYRRDPHESLWPQRFADELEGEEEDPRGYGEAP